MAVFFQNIGQMRNRYPDDQWQEILGSCDTTVFLGCTDMLTANYFSERLGTASVEVESEARELNTMHITNYTPQYRKTNSLGRRPLLTPDEVQRLQPDEELIFVRGQKVLRAQRFDYSKHPDYKKLKSSKAILHEPDWKKASRVSSSKPSSKVISLTLRQRSPGQSRKVHHPPLSREQSIRRLAAVST